MPTMILTGDARVAFRAARRTAAHSTGRRGEAVSNFPLVRAGREGSA